MSGGVTRSDDGYFGEDEDVGGEWGVGSGEWGVGRWGLTGGWVFGGVGG